MFDSFFVIGLEQNNFPKLIGNWNDTVALKNYGNEIDVWLAKYILSKDQAIEFNIKYNKGKESAFLHITPNVTMDK